MLTFVEAIGPLSVETFAKSIEPAWVDEVSVARIMGPRSGEFARVMGPPIRQGHGATRRVGAWNSPGSWGQRSPG